MNISTNRIGVPLPRADNAWISVNCDFANSISDRTTDFSFAALRAGSVCGLLPGRVCVEVRWKTDFSFADAAPAIGSSETRMDFNGLLEMGDRNDDRAGVSPEE